MTMLKDLRQVLENAHSGEVKIVLNTPIKIKTNSMMGETDLTVIYKRTSGTGRVSWIICDVWDNYWTISTLPLDVQHQIYRSLFSRI